MSSFRPASAALLLCVVTALVSRAAEALPPVPEGPPFSPRVHEIRVRVLDLKGHPAPDRVVTLVGLSRSAMHPDAGEPAPAWDFTTNEQGVCVVWLGEHKNLDLASEPGWGTYALHVEASPDDAGAFSPYLVHQQDPEWARQNVEGLRQLEWGQPILVDRDRIDLTLQIKEGFTIKGRILTYPDSAKPFRGLTVSAGYDLYADTHTGRGGEISGPNSVTTDRQGRFTFRHVYPSKCYLAFSGLDETTGWIRTKSDGRWHEDALDSVLPPAKSGEVSLEIVASPRPLFKYTGRVENADRQPVPGAKITFGVSCHREPRTWEDDHHYEDVMTDAAGQYSVHLSTPFIRGYSIEAPGFQRYDRWADESNPACIPPGRHDVRLKSAPPKTAN